MITLFTKRHKELIENDKLKISFSKNQRFRLLKIFNRHLCSRDATNETGFNYSISPKSEAIELYKELKGIEYLNPYAQNTYGDFSFDEFIKSDIHFEILDFLELFIESIKNIEDNDYVCDKKNSEESIIKFTNEINHFFSDEDFPFRMINDHIYKIDSEFLESEIQYKVIKLLKDNRFENALLEFEDAKKRFSTGDYNGCIFTLNSSFESFLKIIFNDKNSNQGDLIKQLKKSDIIPNYFEGFLDSFYGIIQSVFTISNKSVRHGKKTKLEGNNVIDKEISSFYLNLVGTIMIFILNRKSKLDFNELE